MGEPIPPESLSGDPWGMEGPQPVSLAAEPEDAGCKPGLWVSPLCSNRGARESL